MNNCPIPKARRLRPLLPGFAEGAALRLAALGGKVMGVWLLAVLLGALAGCGAPSQQADSQSAGASAAEQPQSAQVWKWKLITAWPKNLPGAGLAAENLAERLRTMSNGRLDITAHSQTALETLVGEHGVQLRPLPDEVLDELRTAAQEVVAEAAKQDELSQRIYASYTAFAERARRYTDLTEKAYLEMR